MNRKYIHVVLHTTLHLNANWLNAVITFINHSIEYWEELFLSVLKKKTHRHGALHFKRTYNMHNKNEFMYVKYLMLFCRKNYKHRKQQK